MSNYPKNSMSFFEEQSQVQLENTFDFLESYQSDKDEDYSEKEELIINKNNYAEDVHKPFEKPISKIEVKHLLKD